jgi:hypothetical protein
MTRRTLRRALFALAFMTTLSIVPTGTAEASARRSWDAAPRQTRVVEGRTILLDLWSRLVSVLAGAGVHMDGNG